MKRAASGWMAVLLFAVGLTVALFFEAWAAGALVFSAGVVVLGVGSLPGDRAVGLVMILAGAGAMVGVLGHLVTGVGP